jgi:hypothetical protein
MGFLHATLVPRTLEVQVKIRVGISAARAMVRHPAVGKRLSHITLDICVL